MHAATYSSAPRCLHLLLRQPHIDVNVQDRAGVTPLQMAVKSNKRAHISMLIGVPCVGDDLYAGKCFPVCGHASLF